MRLILLILIGAIHWLEMKQQLIYLLDAGQTMQHLKDLALKFPNLLQSVQESCPFSAVGLQFMVGFYCCYLRQRAREGTV